MTYSPNAPSYTNNYTEYQDGQPANAQLFNGMQELIADNIRYITDGIYKNIKTIILNYLKEFGVTELEQLITATVSLTNSNTFTYSGGSSILPGDFLIIKDAVSSTINPDYIVMITDNSPANTYTMYESFSGTPATYTTIYKFSLSAAYMNSLYTGFTKEIADVVLDLRAAILAAGGRLSSLSQHNLSSSLGINTDGTKTNFSSLNIIPAGSTSVIDAVQALDAGYYFLSDIKADKIAKKGYTGSIPHIYSSLQTACTACNTHLSTNFSTSLLVAGNEATSPQVYTYPNSDSGTINVSGSACNVLRITATPGVELQSTLTINVTKDLDQLVISGFTLNHQGQIYISTTNKINKLVVTGCNIYPSGDMTDFWLKIDSTTSLGEVIITDNSIDPLDATLNTMVTYGISVDTPTTNAGVVRIVNNNLLGINYIKCNTIEVHNNLFKVGKISAALTQHTHYFEGDLNMTNNNFTIVLGHQTAHAAAYYHVYSKPTLKTNICGNHFFNPATSVFPSFLKVDNSVNSWLTINENVMESTYSSAVSAFSMPAIYIGSYKYLEYNDNKMLFNSQMTYDTDSALIYIGAATTDISSEVRRNSFMLRTLATTTGGAGHISTATDGSYASIILVDNPSSNMHISDNNFRFLYRAEYIRLIMRNSVAAGIYVYAENNSVTIDGGINYKYLWDAAAATNIIDDWYYPHRKNIDDGEIYCSVVPDAGNITGVVNWSTYLTGIATEEAVVIDCAGYFNGSTIFEIKKGGLYSFSAQATFDGLGANGAGVDILNTSASIYPLGITEMGNGAAYRGGPVIASSRFVGNPAVAHFAASASATLPVHTSGANYANISLRIENNVDAGAGHILLTIRRVK